MTRRFNMRVVQSAEAYHRSGAWAGRTIADDARRLAEAGLDLDIFLGGDRPSSAAHVVFEAETLVTALNLLGLRPGDVFSFMLPNWQEAAAINLAAAMGGFVINPIVPIYREAETSLILADCRSRLVFVPTVFRRFDYAAMMARIRSSLPDLRHVVTVRGKADGALRYDDLLAGSAGSSGDLRRVDPASLKMIMYTSGTTGRPKAVLHSHETLARAVASSAEHWGLGPADIVLMASPITHVSGYSNGIERPFLGGTRTVLMEEWRADEAVRLIDRYGATMTVAATPFLQELQAAAERAGSRLPTMRCFACGGAAIPAPLIRRANASFAQPCAFRIYGSSEAPFVTLGFLGEATGEQAATTDGEIVDYEVRIVDDRECPLPSGQDGEILVKGPALFMGYADPAQTVESFTADGFFRTGDIGHIVDGALVITDRKKDLIIRGGENISAKEIEDALDRHPDIVEAAVVAMPHSRLGEGICAFLITRSSTGPDIPALQQFLAGMGLARQKAPERMERVGDLPRTASGKVRKDILRSRIASTITEETQQKPEDAQDA
jgi:acyl-CoA synthetase (AMP-forming)/AMP-acid ligase II